MSKIVSSNEESNNLLEESYNIDGDSYRNYFPVSGRFFESIFFTWFNSVIEVGNSKTLSKLDLLKIPDCISAEEIYRCLLKCIKYEDLKREIDFAGYDSYPPNTFKLPVKLWRALHTMIYRQLWFAGICRFWSDVGVVLGSFLVQRIIIAAQSNDTNWITFYAILILINSVIQAILLQQFIHDSFMAGSRVVTATTSLVYQSSLALRLHKMNPTKSIGEINNIQSKDSSSLRDFVVFFHNLWACPLMIVVCVVYLLFLLGWAGVVCCILLPLLIPLENYIANKARHVRKQVLQKSDLRMSLINELIDGIWTVKLTGLCSYIYDNLTSLRHEELSIGWNSTMIEMVNIVITKSSTLVITLVTFMIYCLVYPASSLTADRVFTALSLINIINRPLQVIPKCVTLLSDALVSCDRIESLMITALQYDRRFLEGRHTTSSTYHRSSTSSSLHTAPEPVITLDNVTAYRYSDSTSRNVVESISFYHQGTGLVMITGSNGSGKTSLLLAMLRELDIDSHGKIIIDSNRSGVAYCGHDSWVLNKSARENILLSSSSIDDKHAARSSVEQHDDNDALEQRYKHAVQSCALTNDFSSWSRGEDTLIGERGINISGGQKQRIALARAFASSCHIILLDAIVSGLDVRVAHDIMESIINESRHRLIILTTNQIDWLQHASRIIHLSKGRIIYDGSYLDYQHLHEINGGTLLSSKSSSSLPADDVKLNSVIKTDDHSVHIKIHDVTLTYPSPKNQLAKNQVSNIEHKASDVVTESRTMKTYLDYCYACGSHNLILAVTLTLLAFGIGAYADMQTARWTDGSYSNIEYLVIYAILSIAVIVANFSRYFMYGYSGYVASKYLHARLLQAIIGATFSFFQQIPSGRITSRFSVDFDTIDYAILSSISSVVDAMLGIVTGVGVVIITSPVYIIFILPLTILYYRFQARYRSVSKELKKLDSASKSPMFSQFRETLYGLEAIRGYGIESKMIAEHYRLLDDSIEARLNWDAANRWLGIRLDIIGSLIVSAAAFSLLLSSSSGGSAGLILTYALKATQSLSFAIRSSTALENMFTSPERVMEYIHIDQETLSSEASLHHKVSSTELAAVNRVHHSILDTSSVPVLSGLSIQVRYQDNAEPVLKGVDFDVYAGKLVGICGRTGCGKSTLSMLLSRGLVHYTGKLLYMGREVNTISLAAYRTAVISIYPQDSYIFSGTIRDFLDPFRLYDDMQVNYVLNELVHAMNIDMILPPSNSRTINHHGNSGQRLSLDTIAGPAGNNLSAGQKQVVVFARAALATTKTVILDEITSHMDPNAAKRAVEIVKEELTKRGIAVILIAHSINDIKMCDEVWVMANGKIIEAGKPGELITRSDGELAKMWQIHMQSESPSIHL